MDIAWSCGAAILGGMWKAVLLTTLIVSGAARVQAAGSVADADPSRLSSGVTGVRPLVPWIADLMGRARAASPTLDAMVRRIAGSPLIVHVDDDVPPRAPFDGRMRFAGRAGGICYIRVDIRPRLMDAEGAALIAHELQHVLETIDGGVTDAGAFARLFRRIGVAVPGSGARVFDTDRAAAVGVQTLMELRAHGWPRCTAGSSATGGMLHRARSCVTAGPGR